MLLKLKTKRITGTYPVQKFVLGLQLVFFGITFAFSQLSTCVIKLMSFCVWHFYNSYNIRFSVCLQCNLSYFLAAFIVQRKRFVPQSCVSLQSLLTFHQDDMEKRLRKSYVQYCHKGNDDHFIS